MTLTFYNNQSENNAINKILNLITTVTGVEPYDNEDIDNPSFIIGTSTLSNMGNSNYVYIESWARYYYIQERTTLPDGMILITLAIDVLMSFKDAILNMVAIVDKIQNPQLANKFFNDGSYVNQEGRFNEIKLFSKGFLDNPVNIIITAGG